MSGDQLAEVARAILRANDRGGYTVPTSGLYPFQWNWDSCLVALGWACFDEPRAWQEIETLFTAQWPTGLVPHIVFHVNDPGYFPGPDTWAAPDGRKTSGATQPPVAAIVVRHLLETAQDAQAAQQAAARLVPKIAAWHRWFATARDVDGLVAVLHPWESGMDNSPAWDQALARVDGSKVAPFTRRDTGHVDPAMRPTQADYQRYMALVQNMRARGYSDDGAVAASAFAVADIGTNAILIRANQDLAHLAAVLDLPDIEDQARRDAARQLAALESRLWDGEAGLFRSYDAVGRALVPAATSAGFLPLMCDGLGDDKATALVTTMARWLDGVRYGLPTVAADDPVFEARRYWRGPTWGFMNYLIGRGLRRVGADALHERLAADTTALVAKSGFCEYYDPVDGTGCGGATFSWTAATWLSWLGGGLKTPT